MAYLWIRSNLFQPKRLEVVSIASMCRFMRTFLLQIVVVYPFAVAVEYAASHGFAVKDGWSLHGAIMATLLAACGTISSLERANRQ